MADNNPPPIFPDLRDAGNLSPHELLARLLESRNRNERIFAARNANAVPTEDAVPTSDANLNLNNELNQGMHTGADRGTVTPEAVTGPRPVASTSSSTQAEDGCWPLGELPIEMFICIAEHLSHDNIKNMRLVCSEFYNKLTAYFIRSLVVRFGPGLSSSLSGGHRNDTGLSIPAPSHRLLSSTCFLTGFGSYVKKFAIACDLTEADLMHPPLVHDMELNQGFLGLYRWPKQNAAVNKSVLVQKIEEEIDQEDGMFKMMAHLKATEEIGLSSDSCLGFLLGPENTSGSLGQNRIIFARGNGEGDFAAHQLNDQTSILPQLLDDESYPYKVLRSQMLEAGVPIGEVASKITELLDFEDTTLAELDKDECAGFAGYSFLPSDYEMLRKRLRTSKAESRCNQCDNRQDGKHLLIKPDRLTAGQKAFIIDHMTAHNALINAYILGIIDSSNAFANVTKFSITSIPSGHVDHLMRQELWDSLPALKEVSLAVNPAWRKLTAIVKGNIKDDKVFPTDSLPVAFKLLEDFIGNKPNITKVHFEWHCGFRGTNCWGENVLPAPFYRSHKKVKNSSLENLLILPYITDLSLKNCWFTPHTFYRAMNEMGSKHSLRKLKLDCVFLSAPPRNDMHDTEEDLYPYTPNHNAHVQPGRPLSWSHVIEMLTPGTTIEETLFNKYSPESRLGRRLLLNKSHRIENLTLKNCGYVALYDYRFVCGSRLGTGLRLHNVQKPLCCRQYMQVPIDPGLADVVFGFDRLENLTLKSVFGLKVDWDTAGMPDAQFLDQDEYYNYLREMWPRPWIFGITGSIQANPQSDFENNVSGGSIIRRDAVPFDTSPFDTDYDHSDGFNKFLQARETAYYESLASTRSRQSSRALPTLPWHW